MPNYRATNADTQEVIDYDEPAPRQEHLSPPWRVERIEDAAPAAGDDGQPEPTPVYGGRRVLTQLEFLRLFSAEERIGIRLFAAQENAYAYAVRDFMHLLELAQEVKLDDPETQQGVPQLEALGLIAAGRAVEILRG